MPRFRRTPAAPQQEAPAAEAYAANKLGSFPTVETVAPRFRVSADNNVLVFSKRFWIAPAVANAAALVFLLVASVAPRVELLPKLFVLLVLGVLPWLAYQHTVVVLNAHADDAQFQRKTVWETARIRIPLSMLQSVKVEPSSSESNTGRAVLSFGQQRMPLSGACFAGSAPANDVALIHEWLEFHNLRT